ncbi:protein CROC-4 isoform X2 [Phoca vitulina]|uniref:protein CROC-4 isoform X2 n=1 Tax=Phoca vitulina TaxID=9720 RepID=UPI001395D7A6|nr:protein CROC-4 isoform X2 [Phoca vitulina]
MDRQMLRHWSRPEKELERGSPALGPLSGSAPHRSRGRASKKQQPPLLVSSWGATLAFRLLTWGGWVLHHPPALFPPRVSQSRIQHHGQLPGGDSMILHIPVLGSPCPCLAPICAQAPVLRPLA